MEWLTFARHEAALGAVNWAMLAAALALAVQPGWIHSVSDISHEFTFYMDGRFYSQYIRGGGSDVRNWGTLWKQDLSNANLLILSSGMTQVPYSAKTVDHVRQFVKEGGAVVILSDARGHDPGKLPLRPVAQAFGAEFLAEPAEGPALREGEPVEFRGGGSLKLDGPWTPVVKDQAGKPLLAWRPFEKGRVLAGVRGLFGSNPDASDNINASWVRPLLQQLTAGKTIDRSRPFVGQFAELTRQVGPLTLEYHEGTERFVEAITEEYRQIRPHLVAVTGVEPAPGMITRLLMLPTGGGGFSSGERIAIGAWWGDYPSRRYPMVELIAHEAGHSWVLPHPEPVWNEPIATYLGIKVGRRMGMAEEADRTLQDAIARARRKDPELKTVDIGKPEAPNDVVWGKTYFIFEELERKFGPGALAKYFRAKRRLVPAAKAGYTLDDCVEVWSQAVGQDLFPWFRSLGIAVDKARVSGLSPRS